MEIKLTNYCFSFRKQFFITIMRAFVFFWCIFVFGGTPNVLSQNAKIYVATDEKVSVDEVFKMISNQTDYKFIYREGLFKYFPEVQLQKGVIYANKLLEKSISVGNVNFEFTDKNTIIVKEKKENVTLTEKQGFRVNGTVTDSKGVPLPGANILEKGTINGAQTDFDGRFSLTTKSKNAILIVTYVGFKPLEVSVNQETQLDIILQEDTEVLEEVLITTALGIKRQKKSLGYAAQEITASDVTISQPVDVAQGLQGKIAGLNINTSNGIANASSRVVIRGNNSLFGRNTPLIVVDGAIVDNSELEQGNVGSNVDSYRDWGNYLSYLDMTTVENITVLKGPNAAALYGARGANGVILITSKKGADRGGIGVEYTMSTTVNQVYRFTDVQNEFGGGFRASLESANPQLPRTANGEFFPAVLYPWQGEYPGSTGINSSHGSIPGGYNSWDVYSWFGGGSSWGPRMDGTQVLSWDGETRAYSPRPNNRDYMFSNGTETAHNLSFSSSNDFGSIRVGFSHKESDAVVENTNSKSTNFSLGSHVNISKVLSADINAGFNQNFRLNTPEIGTNNSWTKFNIYGMTRDYVPIEKDLYFGEDLFDGYRVNFGAAYPHQEYSKDLFWDVYENNDRLWRDEFLATIKLNAEITPWLNAFVRTSTDILSTRFEETNNTNKADGINGGVFNKTVSKGKTFNTDIMATFHKDNILTEGFNASLTLGYNNYSTNTVGVKGKNGSTFKVPNVYSLSNFIPDISDLTPNASGVPKTGSVETRYDVKSFSYIGLLNLSYNDYLFLELTGRKDYTSTLPRADNSTFYPSANASFIFTEALNIDSDILNYGQLRLTWGKSANAAPPYLLDNTYNTGTFGGVITNTRPNTVPPNELTFQTSESKEIGFALGFFNNRLNIDFTYYDIISENQIMTSILSSSSGASNVTFNSGALTNKGIEFIINGDIVRNDNFSWNASFNGAKNTNKIVSLAPGVDQQILASVFGNQGAFIKASPGENYGTIYGTDFELDSEGRKQVMNIYDQSDPTKVIGTQYKVSTEVQKIGNAAPKLTGGIGNNFRYKNFRLNALVDFKFGGDIYSVDHATAMGNGLSPETAAARNGGGLPYTFPDGSTANVGMVMAGFNVDDGRANDRVIPPANFYGITYAGWSHLPRARSLSVFENSWAKLREVSLTYSFPKDVLGKAKIFEDLSLSLVGRNLFYLYTTLPQKLNPEAINGTGNGQGLQWSAFPSIRSIGINIKAGF